MTALLSVIAMFALVGIFYPTPWHKKVFLDKRWKNVVGFVVAVIVIGSITEPAPTDTKQVVADNKQAPKEQKAPSKVYKLGELVDVSNRAFTFTNVSEMDVVKDPMGTSYPAGDDSRFIKIKVTVKNQKKEAVTLLSDEIKLEAKDGTQYSTDMQNETWVNPAGQSLFLAELNPGVSKTAYILFSVPKSVKLADLKLRVTDGGLVDDVIKHVALQ